MDDKKNNNEKLPIDQSHETRLPEKHNEADFAFKWEYTEERPAKKKSGQNLCSWQQPVAYHFFTPHPPLCENPQNSQTRFGEPRYGPPSPQGEGLRKPRAKG